MAGVDIYMDPIGDDNDGYDRDDYDRDGDDQDQVQETNFGGDDENTPLLPNSSGEGGRLLEQHDDIKQMIKDKIHELYPGRSVDTFKIEFDSSGRGFIRDSAGEGVRLTKRGAGGKQVMRTDDALLTELNKKPIGNNRRIDNITSTGGDGDFDRGILRDKSLRDKVKDVFRKGITPVAIFSAIGLSIAAIVESIEGRFGGGGGGGGSQPPNNPSGIREWVKKRLKDFARLLGKLGQKALDALPGFIGSLVSWLFQTAKQVVGYVADHVWTLFVGAGGVVFLYLTRK